MSTISKGNHLSWSWTLLGEYGQLTSRSGLACANHTAGKGRHLLKSWLLLGNHGQRVSRSGLAWHLLLPCLAARPRTVHPPLPRSSDDLLCQDLLLARGGNLKGPRRPTGELFTRMLSTEEAILNWDPYLPSCAPCLLVQYPLLKPAGQGSPVACRVVVPRKPCHSQHSQALTDGTSRNSGRHEGPHMSVKAFQTFRLKPLGQCTA